MSLVPGKRTAENCNKVVQDAKRRTGGRTDLLITTDEHAPYASAIEKAYAVEVLQPKSPGPGRPPGPTRQMPHDLCYATVRKTREKGRVVEVVRTLVFGTMALLGALLSRSLPRLDNGRMGHLPRQRAVANLGHHPISGRRDLTT